MTIEYMQPKTSIYFFATPVKVWCENNHKTTVKITAVAPTNGTPYIYIDRREADRAYRLVQHHSCIVRTDENLMIAVVVSDGVHHLPRDSQVKFEIDADLRRFLLASAREKAYN